MLHCLSSGNFSRGSVELSAIVDGGGITGPETLFPQPASRPGFLHDPTGQSLRHLSRQKPYALRVMYASPDFRNPVARVLGLSNQGYGLSY